MIRQAPFTTGPFGEFAVTAKDAYCSSSIATLGMRKDDARKEEGECCLGTRDSYRTHKYTTQAQMATTLPNSSEFVGGKAHFTETFADKCCKCYEDTSNDDSNGSEAFESIVEHFTRKHVQTQTVTKFLDSGDAMGENVQDFENFAGQCLDPVKLTNFCTK